MADPKHLRPTMDDVAALAGVSQMTVSRVMRDAGPISRDVQERVTAAAIELGYVHNRLAGGLRAEHTPLVAVVVPTLGNRVFAEVLSGINEVLTEGGFQPVFGISEYSLEREESMVRDLLSWRPGGILLPGLEHTDATRAAIAAADIKVVEIMDIDGTPISVAVGLSQTKAGKVTAQHMLDKGYRRFAYIGAQAGRDVRATKRLQGFAQTLREAGATLVSEDIIDAPSSMPEGRKMTAEVLARANPVEAIYYSNDDLAAGGIMHCLAEGLSMPGDVALAGFNGLGFLDALPVQLTTVQTPRFEIGRLAGQLLTGDGREDKGRKGPIIDLGFTLVRGETT